MSTLPPNLYPPKQPNPWPVLVLFIGMFVLMMVFQDQALAILLLGLFCGMPVIIMAIWVVWPAIMKKRRKND